MGHILSIIFWFGLLVALATFLDLTVRRNWPAIRAALFDQ